MSLGLQIQSDMTPQAIVKTVRGTDSVSESASKRPTPEVIGLQIVQKGENKEMARHVRVGRVSVPSKPSKPFCIVTCSRQEPPVQIYK